MYLVPAFTGLGAPYWDPDARGTIVGLTRGTTRAHVARATLESIALQVADVLEAMAADAGTSVDGLRVDGGAAANDLLLQLQADLLGVPVERPVVAETTALGAAYLAGLAVRYWADRAEIESNWALDRRFEPDDVRRSTRIDARRLASRGRTLSRVGGRGSMKIMDSGARQNSESGLCSAPPNVTARP